MSLPVNKISHLKIMKRLFRKMLLKGSLDLLVITLVYMSPLSYFAMSACGREDSRVGGELPAVLSSQKFIGR